MKNMNRIPFVLVLVLSVGCGSTGAQGPETAAQAAAQTATPAAAPAATPERSAEPQLTYEQARQRAEAQLATRAWTDAFQTKAMLLADRIRIEGPVGLIEHVAIRSDDALFRRTSETIPDGFLQRTVPRQSNQDSTDQTYLVRGQLDAWQLTALVEVVVLERPGDVPVTVVAEGNVVWRDRDGAELRDNRLVWTGEIGRVATPSAASAERE